MLASQLPNESIYILRLRPDARHDDVARRTVELATPRAIVVIVNPVVWNCVNLRVLRGQLPTKGVYCRMCSRMLDRALAKSDVELSGVCVGQSLVRIPNCEVVARGVRSGLTAAALNSDFKTRALGRFTAWLCFVPKYIDRQRPLVVSDEADVKPSGPARLRRRHREVPSGKCF